MAGLRETFAQIEREQRIPPERVSAFNPSVVSRDCLTLYGNGEIGQVANWQAVLNHGGLLDERTMFSVSDVVDAVNYKSGDVEPVLAGLRSRAMEHLVDGGKLPYGAPLTRVWRQLEQAWSTAGYADSYGPLRMSEVSEPVEWVDLLTGELGRCEEILFELLKLRKLRCNGPVGALLCDDVPRRAYEQVMSWDRWRSGSWSEFLRRRNAHDKEMEKRTFQERVASGAVYNSKARELSQESDDRFLSLVELREVGPGYMAVAYLQIEAVRGSRLASEQPMRFGPLVALAREDGAFSDELEAFALYGRPVPTLLTAHYTDEEVERELSKGASGRVGGDTNVVVKRA